MPNSSQFQVATRTALEPWSTPDQKLGALAYLESIATPEALAVLRQAMDLVGLYVSPRKDRYNPHLPKAGEVAGAAALAVGRLEHLGGVQVLLKLLLSTEELIVIRECAAYGLGGLTSSEAFNAFEKALQIEDKTVLDMVIKSIQYSYQRLDGISSAHTEDFLVFVFEQLVQKIEMGIKDEYEAVLITLIARNVDRKQESELRDFVKAHSFDASMNLAVKVMLERDSTLAYEALSSVLDKYGGDPDTYLAIGNKFEGSKEPRIIEAAKIAINNFPTMKRILSLFSKSKRASRKAQLKAANMILYGNARPVVQPDENPLEF